MASAALRFSSSDKKKERFPRLQYELPNIMIDISHIKGEKKTVSMSIVNEIKLSGKFNLLKEHFLSFLPKRTRRAGNFCESDGAFM